MRVKLLQDYRGVLTSEMYFRAGEVLEHGAGIDAVALVEQGRAVEVERVNPKPKAEETEVSEVSETGNQEVPKAKPAPKKRGRPRKAK